MADLRAFSWLVPVTGDARAAIRSARTGEDFRALAAQRLDARASANLGKAIARAIAAGDDLTPLSPLRLGVLSSATFDLVTEQLPAAAARHGVALSLVTADYGQVTQTALDPASPFYAARPDAVLLAVDHRWLGLGGFDAGDGALDAGIAQLRAAARAIARAGITPVLCSLPAPPIGLFGNFDMRADVGLRARIMRANIAIGVLADETGGIMLDVAGLAARIGTDHWFDDVQFLAYKLPFAADCAPVYAEMLARILGALRGKTRKCLVLDLDNTLWGGVIGDDGMAGIRIGSGAAESEAFLAVQRYARDLGRRGILLAVSSKNDDAVARGPFRDHPDMLLRESDIAVFQANWTDKPANLRAIAESLNIGLDALVLLDDNPAERAMVRAALPMVAVPELPDDPALFAWTLDAAGYFEALSFSGEDAARAASYAAERARAEVRATTGDLGDYLAGLEMRIGFAPFDALGRARIAQLANKSNQFNLTTRRVTEAEIAAAEADAANITLQVRLSDRFGDSGMIGVVLAMPATHDGEAAFVFDMWLMSCRVLGRRVEEAMLAHMADAARARGARWLVGVYRPTAKNGMVRDHYEKLGFAPLGGDDASGYRWVLDLRGYRAPMLPFA